MGGTIEIRKLASRLDVHSCIGGAVNALKGVTGSYCTSNYFWLENIIDGHYPVYSQDEGYEDGKRLIAIGHTAQEAASKLLSLMFQYVSVQVRVKNLRFTEDPRKETGGLDRLTEILVSNFSS